jgi:NADH-quinone oxidoreductase subunit L
MMLSILFVALGHGAGWAVYGRRTRATVEAPDLLASRFPRLFPALANRLGFDEFYAATVGRLNAGLADLADFLDRFVWDGIVRFLALFGRYTGLVTRETDEQTLNDGFNATSERLRASGLAYSKAQSGDAHSYLRVIALGFVVLLLIVVLGGAR